MRVFVAALTLALAATWTPSARAADDSKLKAATGQVESGAKKIGRGKVGKGVEETAKGIGNTVVEGAKLTGEKVKEAGREAEPKVKSTWTHIKGGATSLGQGVKTFFSRLFSSERPGGAASQ
jgi:hypothetical protein